MRPTRSLARPLAAALLAGLLAAPIALDAQGSGTTARHNVRSRSLAIRNATIVDGNGTPARGPADILIVNDTIAQIVWLDQNPARNTAARRVAADAEIDATGKFVLPGLINAHAHLQRGRAGYPQPYEYTLKLWLASGITTFREVGSDSVSGLLSLRAAERAGTAMSPRVYAYLRPGSARTPAQARERVRAAKAQGADGLKLAGLDRDILMAILDEAKQQGLRVAHHVGVEETTAWDDIAGGTTTIEHWYGIPDAAIPSGRQSFPSDYDYNDETDRFRWAGRLWREADPALLDSVLKSMVRANVGWVPTLDIYEASRDLQRAQTQPWFRDYLHPALEEYFKPDPSNHGSYFIGWSSTDETYWKENYQIWFRALRRYEELGGTIACGDDAGFIYQLYGFGLIREMELHQEAGFHPLKVIQHCTGNAARLLGEENRLGRVRAGWKADLIVVDGNPLEDFKVLYPGGTTRIVNGQSQPTLGIEWTIKGGMPYHGPTLMREVKEIVDQARAQRSSGNREN
ncbi:MAG TPA: amidohydrolase family protein [Gemmatimonadaceae bacterium]|nr:amidohydrolase family protein [Gemmatimonadaceae bacterium]HRQ77629.1 amidohydrolase family protein [Gemmatimonadaceae bacterium]